MLALPAAGITAIRGAVLTFTGDPFLEDPAACMRYESDAMVVMADGHVVDFGPASEVAGRVPAGTRVTHYADALITAGFVDAHVHYPQTEIIASYGRQLLDWLNDYTFPAEQAFADTEHARRVAKFFLQRMPARRHDNGCGFLHGARRLGRRILRGSRSARHAHARRQGADGSQRAGDIARHGAVGLRRQQGGAVALARSGSPPVLRHAAVRGHQFGRPARRSRRVVARTSGHVSAIAHRGKPQRNRVGP